MPDTQWLKKFAPWLVEHTGATGLEAMEVHAANHMVTKLQVQRIGTLQEIRDAVATYVIHGKTEGDPPLVNSFDMEQLQIESRRQASADLGAKFGKLQASMERSKAAEVVAFNRTLEEMLQLRYAETPQTAADYLPLIQAAYAKDHGQPLFSREGEMASLEFTGGRTLPEAAKEVYDQIKRVTGFGPESWRRRDERLEYHAAETLKTQFPSAPPEEITRKVKEKEYGSSVEISFDKKEMRRKSFSDLLRAEIATAPLSPAMRDERKELYAILDKEITPEALKLHVEPHMRINTYHLAMNMYDAQHSGHKRTIGNPDIVALYRETLLKLEQQEKAPLQGKLKADGSGRSEGPRPTAPKSDGPEGIA